MEIFVMKFPYSTQVQDLTVRKSQNDDKSQASAYIIKFSTTEVWNYMVY